VIDDLEKKSKAELMQLGQDLSLPVTDSNTKAEIAAAIREKQAAAAQTPPGGQSPTGGQAPTGGQSV
jgi:hypothetical protein